MRSITFPIANDSTIMDLPGEGRIDGPSQDGCSLR
jgi:hypothetical protein